MNDGLGPDFILANSRQSRLVAADDMVAADDLVADDLVAGWSESAGITGRGKVIIGYTFVQIAAGILRGTKTSRARLGGGSVRNALGLIRREPRKALPG